jgi:hypothetical protein
MRSINLKNGRLTWISLLLAIPTTCFLGISVLKFELGINAPYDAISPVLARTGIAASLGWNNNLLILLGPVVVFALSIFRVLRIRLQFTQNHFLFQCILKKRWLPLLVAALSASLLGILFIYLVRENCTG